MNFSSKQTNPLLPTLLLSGSHMFARLPLPHLLALSRYLQTFACPHSLPLFAYLCSPTTPSHICIRLLAIPVFSLPIISYISSSPLLNPSPYARLFSLFEYVCFLPLPPTRPILLFSCNHSPPFSHPPPMFAHLPLSAYVCFPLLPPRLLPTSINSVLFCIRCLLACPI